MGWSSFHMNKGETKNWFINDWQSNGKYKVLDCAIVNRSVMYGAIQNNETMQVFCAVFLIRYGKGYMNFSYKDMTEFEGPCESNCPKRIFKFLSELNDLNDPSGWAREWRKKVEEGYLNSEKLSETNGKVIKTSEPVKFTNGSEYSYFKKVGRRVYAGVMFDHNFIDVMRVRVNLRNYSYTLV